jgi:secondary thiamine-phosphate synthase enzyme
VKQAIIESVETVHTGRTARQAFGRLTVETPGPGFTDLTTAIAEWTTGSGIEQGLLTVFCRHTSASITIQENADPDVQRDLMTSLDRLAPRRADYLHDMEGPDDMPSHIRAMLTGVCLNVPVMQSRLALGTWQGIYLIEHRDAPHRREIVLHLLGA